MEEINERDTTKDICDSTFRMGLVLGNQSIIALLDSRF